MLRAAYPSMKKVAEKILIDSCAYGVDKDINSISEILDLIPQVRWLSLRVSRGLGVQI